MGKKKKAGRQSIPVVEQKVLCLRSGNLCAFPGCGRSLVIDGPTAGDPVVTGKIAHIVADSRQGPRGVSPLTDEERDRYPNLILLCQEHHDLVDDFPMTYSVAVLRQMKVDHEADVQRRLAPATPPPAPVLIREDMHSCLLPVSHLPRLVYAAPCGFHDGQEKAVKARVPRESRQGGESAAFVLREGKLFAFHDLRTPGGPFSGVIDSRSVEVLRYEDLWATAEGGRRYMCLLNRSLIHYASGLGLRFDPRHRRFYFPPLKPGEERSQKCRPLNRKKSSLKVVWQPRSKLTGQTKGFWAHRAARLSMHRVAGQQWCLSIRPGRHLTADGENLLPPDQVGRRVTRMKARMFNDLYLREVNLWRDFLSDSSARFTIKVAGQPGVVVETKLLAFQAEWPGVPDDATPFTNRVYEEDLFSLAALSQIGTGRDEEGDFDDADNQ